MASSPNILLLFCDQLRADVLGCYAGTVVATPALDALAARGLVFDSAYTPSPVCVPARCSLITGLEPQATACFDNGFAMPDRPTAMDMLRERGYRTHGVGKMHFTPDSAALRGFDTREVGEEFGTADTDDYLRHLAEAGHAHVERPLGQRSEMYYVPQVSPVPAHLHHSHWVADRSIAFLEGHDTRTPFFLWSSFIAPHPPFAPPVPWHRLYAPGLLPPPFVPEGADELLTVHNRHQNRYKFRDTGDDRNLVDLIRAYYYASISFVDAQIGRILAALDRRDLAEDTVVVLAADHGELLGDYGSFGKRSFLDAAARIPLLMAGPGVPVGREAAPVSLVDLVPTLAGLAGAPCPPSDGQDLRDLAGRDEVFGQFQTGDLGLYAVITSAAKYVYSAADRREILLDRVRDPRESRNLAYGPHARPALLRMRDRAVAHFTDLAGSDLDSRTHNRPITLGAAPGGDAAARYAVLDRSRDAGGLVLPAPVDPDPGIDDGTWARYRALAQAGHR